MDIKPTVHFDRDVTLKLQDRSLRTNGNRESRRHHRADHHAAHRRSDDPSAARAKRICWAAFCSSRPPNSRSAVTGSGAGTDPEIYLQHPAKRSHRRRDCLPADSPCCARRDVDPENVQQLDTGTTNNIELRQITTPHAVSGCDARASSAIHYGICCAAGCSRASARAAAHRGDCGQQQAMSNMQQQANPAAPVNLQLTPPQSTAKSGFDFPDDGQSFRRKRTSSRCRWRCSMTPTKLTLINVDTDDPQQSERAGKRRAGRSPGASR